MGRRRGDQRLPADQEGSARVSADLERQGIYRGSCGGNLVMSEELICTWCLDNTKSCKACDDSYEGE